MQLMNMKNQLFRGRLSRSNLLLGFLYYFGILLAAAMLAAGFPGLVLSFLPQLPKDAYTTLIVIWATAYYLGCSVLLAGLLTRRLHDLNRSGSMAWLLLLPVINLTVILYVLLVPGSSGDNQYGPINTTHNFYTLVGLKRPTTGS